MPRRYAYRCELLARALDGTYEAILATYRAPTPRLAARWARDTASRYAELLAPTPAAPYLGGAPLIEAPPEGPPPDVKLHAWADSDELYEGVLRTLAAYHPYAFTVTDYGARYELRLDPLPARRPAQAPGFPHAGKGMHRQPRVRRQFSTTSPHL
ncbi:MULTISPECIES: hypothetical protein [unclassified Streptomyces]|uniref:hypothetical protein n=1 Tax=unclassified Streptomyces TaxID=2593676 RepID=UPI002E17772D|nr:MULTISPECIES: hypothetical protein [unclassified Streptomyces]